MTIRLIDVKSVLWFFVILLLVASFPLQVITNSPYPALFPYVLIGGIVFLTLCFPNKIKIKKNRSMSIIINVYVALLFLNTCGQFFLGLISPTATMNAFAIYLLPVIFYWYFRSAGTDQEIRAVLVGVAVAGLIVGLYFALDSYEKLVLGKVTDYAKAAFQYSIERSDTVVAQANDARVNLGSRSFGLLQTHSVSGTWVVLGSFAFLALIPARLRMLRRISIYFFGGMLLLGLNFTSIVAYAVIIFLFEFSGILLLEGRLSMKFVVNIISLLLGLTLMIFGIYYFIGSAMFENIAFLFSLQKDLVFSLGQGNSSFFGLIVDTVVHFTKHVLSSPLTILLGDGFTTYGFEKGGDIGFIETLAQLGLPFFLVVVFGLLRLLITGWLQVKFLRREKRSQKTNDVYEAKILEFSICVTLLILIADFHYSVWVAKAVMPILFFALAIFSRFSSLTLRKETGLHFEVPS